MRTHVLLGVVFVNLVLAGCGGKRTPAPPPPSPPKTASALGTLLPGVPPPPPLANPGANPAAAPPAFDFTAKYRPLDRNGVPMSDLALLNQAIMQFGATALANIPPTTSARSPAEDIAAMTAQSNKRPRLKDLSELVKSGFIKALPVPPPGKEYVLDAKSGLAVLADKK